MASNATPGRFGYFDAGAMGLGYSLARYENSSQPYRTLLRISVSTGHGIENHHGRRGFDPVWINDLGSLRRDKICQMGFDHISGGVRQYRSDFDNCFQPLKSFRLTRPHEGTICTREAPVLPSLRRFQHCLDHRRMRS